MNELTTNLAEQINDEHERARGAIRDALTHGIKCGELLTQAKAGLKHGDWGKWITDNCHFSDRTARLYMRLAENREELEKTATIADLTLNGAAGLLAEPKQETHAKLPDDEPRDETLTIRLRKSTLKKLQGKAKYRGIELEEFIQQDIDPDPKPDLRDPYSQAWTYWGLEAQGIPLINGGMKIREGFPDLPSVRNPTREEEAGLQAGTRPDLIKKISDYEILRKAIMADIQAEHEAKSANRGIWHAARQIERIAAGMVDDERYQTRLLATTKGQQQ